MGELFLGRMMTRPRTLRYRVLAKVSKTVATMLQEPGQHRRRAAAAMALRSSFPLACDKPWRMWRAGALLSSLAAAAMAQLSSKPEQVTKGLQTKTTQRWTPLQPELTQLLARMRRAAMRSQASSSGRAPSPRLGS
jgi:hypothetical protein